MQSGFASAMRAASSVKPVKSRRRCSASRSIPMLTHTSVNSTSASRAASSGSFVSVNLSPYCFASISTSAAGR